MGGGPIYPRQCSLDCADVPEHPRIRGESRWVLALASGTLLILGALFEGSQQWFWLGALLVNITAATVGAREEWSVDAKHFAERHGLIMIIALGEAIIVVGTQLSGAAPGREIASYLVIGLALAMTLYWAYFDRAQEIWEHGLRRAGPDTTGRYARDVYSFTHFPMIVGIVLSAVTLEEAFLHPNEPLEAFVGALFSIGIASFVLGVAFASYRAAGVIKWERVFAAATAVAVIVGLTDLAGPTAVALVTLVLVAAMLIEHTRHRTTGATT